VQALESTFTLIVFDNPGIGRTKVSEDVLSTDLFADVALSILSHLDIRRCHVVGTSMGGLVAQAMAIRDPSAVRSLTLHSSWWYPDGFTTALLRSWQSYARVVDRVELLRQVWLWVLSPRIFVETPEIMRDLELHVAKTADLQTAEDFCAQASACIAHRALDEVETLEIPTLITVGDRDLLTQPWHSLALHERIGGSRLHIWPDMGHAPFWEIPNAFNELTAEFLMSSP
jgi:pimeloyl-ACP methyl ester carboxylesterase